MHFESGINADASDSENEESEAETTASSSDDDEDERGVIIKDFIAATPSDSDIAGIEVLCKQLLRTSDVDANELAKLLVEQNYVTTVMKSAPSDIPGEEDDEQIYGVFGVINLKTKKDNPAVKEFAKWVLEATRDSTNSAAKEIFESVMIDSSHNDLRPAFLVKERILNIPGIAAPPFLQQLRNDMRESALKGMPYDFTHYIHVAKVLVLSTGVEYFIDQEDEAIHSKNVGYVDHLFKGFESDMTVVFEDSEGNKLDGCPFRRFYIITEEQLQQYVEAMTKVSAVQGVMHDAHNTGLKL